MLLPLTEILGLTQKQNDKSYVVAPACNPNGIVQQKPSGHSLSSLFSTLSYTISLSLSFSLAPYYLLQKHSLLQDLFIDINKIDKYFYDQGLLNIKKHNVKLKLM